MLLMRDYYDVASCYFGTGFGNCNFFWIGFDDTDFLLDPLLFLLLRNERLTGWY